MATKSLRIFGTKMVLWDTPAGGDVADSFDRFVNPQNHLSDIYYNSAWDNYTAEAGYPTTVSKTHTAVAADAGTSYGNGSYIAYNSVVETDYTLVNHALGRIPRFVVLINGIEVTAGYPIDFGTNGARRSICAWADTSNIYVKDCSKPSIPGLPAITVLYTVLIFIADGDIVGEPLFNVKLGVGGFIKIGKGRVSSSKLTMREAGVGETPTYQINAGETGDISNGRIRFVLSDGTAAEIGPIIGPGAYNGTFMGGAYKTGFMA